MQETSINNKRIAKNTIMLYLRMMVILVVGLYTSRLVLALLGISDYGLYNVVGGFVTMLAFLNVTMANGTQRFLTFTIGEGNIDMLKSVFSNALLIHLALAAFILVFAETIGLWFVLNKMNIPAGRETAAFWIYQFSVLSFVISVFQVPFMSSIIAHEKMDIYAYLTIYDVIFKLLIVFLIQIVSFDRLILYASLICFIQLSDALLYNLYCQKQFVECRLRFEYKPEIFKKMMGFSIWTMVGSLGFTTNSQGVNVLLNLFYGTVVNAARGVAVQVNNIIVNFSKNFQIASNPQIIKLYAEGKIRDMTNLALRTSKFSGFLLMLLMMPLFIEIEFVLKIWLGEYPELSPIFVRIIMFQSIVQSLSGPIVTVTHAGGKLKMPNLTAGIAIVSFLPITYVALKLGASPAMVFVINVIPWIIEGYCDSYYAQKYTGFSMKRFYKEVYSRVFICFFFVLAVLFITKYLLGPEEGWIRFLLLSVLSVLLSICTIYLLGLKDDERAFIICFIRRKLKFLNKNKCNHESN